MSKEESVKNAQQGSLSKRHLSLIVIVILFSLATAFLIAMAIDKILDANATVLEQAEYKGEMTTDSGKYEVEIIERFYRADSLEELVSTKTVHLFRVEDDPSSVIGRRIISGEDYLGGFSWDRIFFCNTTRHPDGPPENHESVCSSMRHFRWYRGEEKWQWQPVGKVMKKTTQIVQSELNFLIRELNQAVAEIYSDEHLVLRYERNKRLNKLVKVLDRTELDQIKLDHVEPDK